MDSGLNPWVKLNSKARISARNWWVGPMCIGMWLKRMIVFSEQKRAPPAQQQQQTQHIPALMEFIF